MLEDREDRTAGLTMIASEVWLKPECPLGEKKGGELGRATGLLSKVLDRADPDAIG